MKLPEPCQIQGRGKGSKKKPGLRLEDRGFTRKNPSQSYPRRPFREAYPGRFSDSRIFLLLAPSHPSPFDMLRVHMVASASFVPEYSGGSVPDFPVGPGLRGSLHLDINSMKRS
jgi:hypothetical protein